MSCLCGSILGSLQGPKLLALGKGRFLHRWRLSFDILRTF